MKNLVPTLLVASWLAASQAKAQIIGNYFQSFDTTSDLTGIVYTNLSTRNSTGNPWGTLISITDTNSSVVVAPHSGDQMAYANFRSIGSGTGTINNWMIMPELASIQNGSVISFYTTTTTASAYPDRLELRLSTNSASTDVGATPTSVGDFTTLLTTVNSALTVGGYPETWTEYTATISGLSGPVDGRLAFRYFVTSGGPTGANSNIIAVDDVSFVASATPEPSTWALLLSGLTALFYGFRRKNRRA